MKRWPHVHDFALRTAIFRLAVAIPAMSRYGGSAFTAGQPHGTFDARIDGVAPR